MIPPGSIAATAKNIVCDEDARTPLVTKSQLAAMNSADATGEQLASMNFFELKRDKSVTTYYQSVQAKGASPLEKDAIVSDDSRSRTQHSGFHHSAEDCR